MKQWHFFDKVYRVWVAVLVSEPEEFYQFMADHGYNDVAGLKNGSTTAYCINLNSDTNNQGNECYILWFRKFETACFVHELAHLVMFIFDDKGIPIRMENTEAFSYYQEFWFNEISRVRKRLPDGRLPKEVKKHD